MKTEMFKSKKPAFEQFTPAQKRKLAKPTGAIAPSLGLSAQAKTLAKKFKAAESFNPAPKPGKGGAKDVAPVKASDAPKASKPVKAPKIEVLPPAAKPLAAEKKNIVGYRFLNGLTGITSVGVYKSEKSVKDAIALFIEKSGNDKDKPTAEDFVIEEIIESKDGT